MSVVIEWESESCVGKIRELRVGLESRGWIGTGVRRDNGRPLTPVEGSSAAEVIGRLRHLLTNFRLVEPAPGARQEEQDDAIRAMLEAGDPLPKSLWSRAIELGLLNANGTVKAPAAEEKFYLTEEDRDVVNQWSLRPPQNEYLRDGDPRMPITREAIVDYLIAHARERAGKPVTRAFLDRMWKDCLCPGGMVQVDLPHRRGSSRAGKYSAENDPTLRKPSQKLTEQERAAANAKLVAAGFPQESVVTLEAAARVLGEELAKKLFEDSEKK